MKKRIVVLLAFLMLGMFACARAVEIQDFYEFANGLANYEGQDYGQLTRWTYTGDERLLKIVKEYAALIEREEAFEQKGSLQPEDSAILDMYWYEYTGEEHLIGHKLIIKSINWSAPLDFYIRCTKNNGKHYATLYAASGIKMVDQGKRSTVGAKTPAPKPTAKPTPKPTAKPAVKMDIQPGQVVRITNTRNVNVRTGPGTGYDAIGSVKPQEVFSYLGTQSGWHCIQYAYGVKGYVSGSLSQVENADKTQHVRITNQRAVNVRTGPGTDYEAFSSVKPDETYDYIGTRSGWHCIRLQNGSTGYVSANLASVEIKGQPLKKVTIQTESDAGGNSGGSGGNSGDGGSSGGHWEWQWQWNFVWEYGSDGLPKMVRKRERVHVWVEDN